MFVFLNMNSLTYSFSALLFENGLYLGSRTQFMLYINFLKLHLIFYLYQYMQYS